MRMRSTWGGISRLPLLLFAFICLCGSYLFFQNEQQVDFRRLELQKREVSIRVAQRELSTQIASLAKRIESISLFPSSSPSFPQRNLLYVKIPKTASSTFQRIVYNIASKYYKVPIPYIDPTLGEQIETCNGLTRAKQEWTNYITNNGGKIHLFGLHACFHSFMMEPQYWASSSHHHQQQRPFLMTLMRNPYDHYVSTYRYHKYCCNNQEAWCQSMCPFVGNLSEFNKYLCQEDYCSQQTVYMGRGEGVHALDKFDLILIVERLDESLALLAVKLSLPVHVLFYIAENANVKVEKTVPGMTLEFQQEMEQTYLKTDVDNYRLARTRLDESIAQLSPVDKGVYDTVLSELQAGNARLATACVKACDFDGFSISKCMQQCWALEKCTMGKEVNWW